MNKAEIFSMVRSNRPGDLKEWADYHLAIGFDKITIVDNESTFSVKELFSNYKVINVRQVKIDVAVDAAITVVYDFFSKEKQDENNYIAFIDDDEYIYTKENKSIKTILNNEMEVLCLYWRLLSSNNILEDRKGTMIDTFNYASNTGVDGLNTIPVKPIVNFNQCKDIKWITDGPHLPTTDNVMKTFSNEIFKNGFGNRHLSNNFYDNQGIYLYHYFYQTHQDWLFKIKKRPHFSDGRFFSRPEYSILDNNMINRKKELGI
jgi:hypothetical protein